MMDWQSQQSHLLLNPRWPQTYIQAAEKLYQQRPELAGHIWISTSGSTQADGTAFKLVALSKHAFLTSACAVNEHLQSNKADIWLLVLPTFHVGGLSIFARAHLSGARVEQLTYWDPRQCHKFMIEKEVSLSALVPAQLYDLVQLELKSPPQMRAIVIGGGILSENLWSAARKLGWPVLPSYGMTECCSQVATAQLASLETQSMPEMELLNHVQAQINSSGYLGIESPALLSVYGRMNGGTAEFWDPRVNGVFWAEDRVELNGPILRVLGRDRDFLKINGENVNIFALNQILQRILTEHAAVVPAVLVPVPDPRQGHRVELVWEGEIPQVNERVCQSFNAQVAPFERIQAIHMVEHFPRTALGKLIQPALLENIEF